MQKTGPKNLSNVLEKQTRAAYLNGKGIKPSEPYQLELLFPLTIGSREDLRHIPNDYARSSLFSARNKRQPRVSMMRQELFHYNAYITLVYSGFELRAEDDELVWLQLLSYAQKSPLGEEFEFELKTLVSDIGWSKSGRNYDRARECITRLKASEVLAQNSKAYGTSGAISLIAKYAFVNDGEGKPTKYKVSMDTNLMVLFAGNTFTSHKWERYRKLSPVARRLADYVESHKHPHPLDLNTFNKLCGSSNISRTSWRQTVRKACKELTDENIATLATLDKHDKILVVTP
jgi:TrfA protein